MPPQTLQTQGHDSQGAQVVQQADASFIGHCDWVNDAVLLGNNLLATCSSDRTICIWNAKASGGESSCLRGKSAWAMLTCQLNSIRPAKEVHTQHKLQQHMWLSAAASIG